MAKKKRTRKVYSWDYPGIKISAPATAKLFEDLRKRQDGRLYPKDVVKAAKPKASPTHAAFEWNDAKAANEHRLETARKLIRGLREDEVEIGVTIDRRKKTVPRRVFVHVSDEGDEGRDRYYAKLDELADHEDLMVQVVGEAESQLLAMRSRLLELQKRCGVVSKIVDAIDSVLRDLKKRESA